MKSGKAVRRWVLGLAGGVALLVAALVFAQGNDGMSDTDRATMLLDMARGQNYEYTWHYETDVPAGFYKGLPPHGDILRTYMNAIAHDAAMARTGAYPPGAFFMKENHMPVEGVTVPDDKQTAIAGFPGNLAAYTMMVKISDYDPDNGDWFYAKIATDGTIDAAGRVEGCIGCHTSVKDNDYIYDAAVK